MNPKQKSGQKPNVYAFIDSQNLNVGTQKFGWKMNWARFRIFLAEEYNVTKAFMFIGYIPENEGLYDQMHDAGFLVVLKPTFDMTRLQPEAPKEVKEPEPGAEPEEKKPVKGNIDADLVLWTMKELKNYDKAIIVSGDGDFYSLVEYLEAEHKLLHLLTPSGHYSQLYNKYEQYVVRLDNFKRTLAYRTTAHRRPSKK
jgi:uncharacterized LabA/DUF88 family protein